MTYFETTGTVSNEFQYIVLYYDILLYTLIIIFVYVQGITLLARPEMTGLVDLWNRHFRPQRRRITVNPEAKQVSLLVQPLPLPALKNIGRVPLVQFCFLNFVRFSLDLCH